MFSSLTDLLLDGNRNNTLFLRTDYITFFVISVCLLNYNRCIWVFANTKGDLIVVNQTFVCVCFVSAVIVCVIGTATGKGKLRSVPLTLKVKRMSCFRKPFFDPSENV